MTPDEQAIVDHVTHRLLHGKTPRPVRGGNILDALKYVYSAERVRALMDAQHAMYTVLQQPTSQVGATVNVAVPVKLAAR